MNNYSKMNPFYASAVAQANFEASIHELQPDYNVVSTFAGDYAIADAFGADAVEDTYRRSMASFSEDIFMLTEMALVLNWGIWRYWEIAQDRRSTGTEDELARIYDKLWKELDSYIMDHFDGEQLQFYLKTVD